MSGGMDESMSVLPGESGSVAEVLAPAEGLGQSGSGESTTTANAEALTAAFHFTGTSASANGATMQEYFIQTVISSAQQHDLLVTRLHGLSREWTEFCDQEVSLKLGTEDRADTFAALNSRSMGNTSAAAGVLASVGAQHGSPTVNVRFRRSLTHALQSLGRPLSVLRYLGAVETDKMISRRSCLEVPVAGPLLSFLHELGFESEFTYVAEGQMFIRGRVKALVYTINEITQVQNVGGGDPGSDFLGSDTIPKEWRRICPRSWMVEISAVGAPADESLQDEVSDFADLLYPLVTPIKVDPSTFVRK
ncbi:unnamed protein product [Calicophoron daubneyi]|uniref:Mediator of RNA polymerase II transcription subunit 18 n=1 Tax=Calicophoron daubneyi TaxID=300641 RepID=A0AAV2TEP2_CALDB